MAFLANGVHDGLAAQKRLLSTSTPMPLQACHGRHLSEKLLC